MTDLKVSKVLHLSNITHNISRFDIIDEISKVRSVKQVFVLRPNNQALVEMFRNEDALAVYNQFKNKKLIILGNDVDIKFSRYEQLVRSEDLSAPRCVLLVSIICRDNSTLSLRYFYSICSRYGTVLRIRMFIHQAGPQALVQYLDLCNCMQAKTELENATVFLNNRRYSFEVQYSKLNELVIHKNNNYSRDFQLYPLDDFQPYSPYETGFQRKPTYAGVSSESYSFSSGSSPLPENDSIESPTNRSQLNPLPFPSERSLWSGLEGLERRGFDMLLDDHSPELACFKPQERLFPLFSCKMVLRKYVLEGFMRQMPIMELADLLYGINIQYTEFVMENNGFVALIYGESEWSDAMLSSYLNSNPVNGRIIRLRGSSQVVR